MNIGIFDSGMGGLSVLHRALRMIPEADFLYYADEEHVPYGEKTREQVRGYIDEIIAFMIKKQVDAIVIACNTATSVATKEYRSQFPLPIVGMEPAVKKAVEESWWQQHQSQLKETSFITWWTGWISVIW